MARCGDRQRKPQHCPRETSRPEPRQAVGNSAATSPANGLSTRATLSGQHIRIQLHDEDPGAGCLRMDAPVGADLGSSPLIPDPYCLGTNGYEFSAISYSPAPFLRGAIDSRSSSGVVLLQEAKTSHQTTSTATSAISCVITASPSRPI